jgi:hypothetical protein
MNNTAQWNGPHTLIGLADCCTTALVKDARKCREPHRFSAHAIPLSGTNSVRELIDCSRLQMLPTLAVEQRASTSTIVRYLLMFSKFLTLDTVPRPRIASSRFDSMSLPHSAHSPKVPRTMRSRACLRFWRVCRDTSALCANVCLSYSAAAWSAVSGCLAEIARISCSELAKVRSVSAMRASRVA